MKKLFNITLVACALFLYSCGGDGDSSEGGEGSVDLSKPVTAEQLYNAGEDAVGEEVTIKQTCSAAMSGNVVRFPKPGEEDKSMFDAKGYAKCVFKKMWSGKSGDEQECTIKGKVESIDEKDGVIVRECEWVE